jgi:hypothetical protein
LTRIYRVMLRRAQDDIADRGIEQTDIQNGPLGSVALEAIRGIVV